MDDQAHYDSHHVHAQLPGHHLQVSNGRDLPCDQRGDAKGRVPATRESGLDKRPPRKQLVTFCDMLPPLPRLLLSIVKHE